MKPTSGCGKKTGAAADNREGGFSLIEITIAVVISAVLVLGMYETFFSVQRWWRTVSAKSDMSQNARAGLETLTRDIEMAGYHTTKYQDVNKVGLAVTLADTSRIEVDQQRLDIATGTYVPRLVYYHTATDVNTGKQNLLRQIRTAPGVPAPDEIVAENVVSFTLSYFGCDQLPPNCRNADLSLDNFLPQQYQVGVAPHSMLRRIRRIQVRIATLPSGATTLKAPVVAGSPSITVDNTAGFPPSGKLTLLINTNSAGNVVFGGSAPVTYTSKDPSHFIGCSGIPDAAVGSIAARPLQSGAVLKPVVLTASVSPQNLTTNENINDTTPPAVPTGVASIDNRSCTQKLQVRWNKNTEPDLAGYVISYGPSETLEIPLYAVTGQAGTTISYALNPPDLLITKNDVRGTLALNNRYSIQLQAYDSFGNYSAKSAAISGPPDPNTDVTAFGTPNHDTTVNPLKPAPPVSLTVDGSTTGRLLLAWSPSVPATAGYRLYRSETPFPVGAGQTISPTPTIALIADENELTKDVTTFTDLGTDLPLRQLLACVTYYYAIASVNCDETLVPTYRNPAVGSDYTLASGQFTDSTPPPPPSLAGTIAGWRRIFITLLNPTTEQCEDFAKTEIWYNKGLIAAPHLDGTTIVGTPAPATIPNNGGIFTARGSQTSVFASETVPTTYTSPPTLDNEIQYNLFAVASDRCGNLSSGEASSVTIRMCGDDSAGPPPGSPSNPTYTSCQMDTVQLGWEYEHKSTLLDFAGYHIERTGPLSTTIELTSGPTWMESWVDSGTLQAGGAYTYSIRATDCVYENKHAEFPLNRSLPLNIGPIYPGTLQQYDPQPSADPLDAVNFVTTISDDPTAFTYHNNVKFHLQNTSAGTLTLARMAINWENPNVVLDSVTIGGSPGITPTWTIAAGGVASGVPFPINVQIRDVASGIGAPSTAIPVLLRFVTPSGVVNRLTDMRSEDLELVLWINNDSIQTSACVDPDYVVIRVPRGPVIGGFAQDRTALATIDSYAVVGQTGTARDTDLQVSGGLNINVFGTVFDNSGALFADGVDRGYAAGYPRLVGATASPAAAEVVPVMPPSTFTRTLHRTFGENYAIYKTTPLVTGERMPMVSERVTWYYGLVLDVTGNWDREPNPDVGNFAYYQPSNVSCSAPLPPSPLQVMSTAGIRPALDQAVLTWTRPSLYVDGTAIGAETTILYDVYRNDNGVAPFTELLAANLTATSWIYVADLQISANYFVVVAKNNCATHNASDISNVGRECVGAGSVYCTMFDVPTSATIDLPFTVSLNNACLYTNGNTTDKVNFRVQGLEDKYVLASETTDGNFSANITPRAGATSLPNEVRGSASFTISLYNNASPTKTQLPPAPAAQCSKTVALVASGCSTFPGSPSPVNARSLAAKKATVTWGASTSTPDPLGGYEVAYQYQTCTNYRSGRCRNWGSTVPYGSSTAVAAGTTTYTYTFTNTAVTRYKFRVRAKDTCSTGPNYSSWVELRDWLQVNP